MAPRKDKEDIDMEYFAWNSTLENSLIECMGELVAKNHIENGVFKGGAYKELEKMMESKVLGSGIMAYPHIKSRLKILKTKHQAYQLRRGQSGWGWDDAAKCLVVDNDIFNNFVMINPNCRGLNGKPFPQYESLLVVCENGKGHATGQGTMGANENTLPYQKVHLTMLMRWILVC